MSIAAQDTVEFFKESSASFPHEMEDVYRSKMMGIAIARSICDPNDVLAAHPAFPALEDRVAHFFSPDGVRLVYEMLDEMTVTSSPVTPVANDERLKLLNAHLRTGTIGKVKGVEQLMVRRLLGRALEVLEASAPEVSVFDGDSIQEEADADDVPAYAVQVQVST